MLLFVRDAATAVRQATLCVSRLRPFLVKFRRSTLSESLSCFCQGHRWAGPSEARAGDGLASGRPGATEAAGPAGRAGPTGCLRPPPPMNRSGHFDRQNFFRRFHPRLGIGFQKKKSSIIITISSVERLKRAHSVPSIRIR